MFFLLSIYAVVGGFSAVTNLGKWLFSNVFIMVIFTPFFIVHLLIYGDQEKKTFAITIIKTIVQLAILYFVVLGLIMLIQKI